MQISNVLLHQSAAVSRQTIPHDQQRLTKVTHQGRKKIHDLFFLDGTGIDAKVEIPQREAGSDRQTLPIELYCMMGSVREVPRYGNDAVADSVRFRR